MHSPTYVVIIGVAWRYPVANGLNVVDYYERFEVTFLGVDYQQQKRSDMKDELSEWIIVTDEPHYINDYYDVLIDGLIPNNIESF